jgi:hypothetical protein
MLLTNYASIFGDIPLLNFFPIEVNLEYMIIDWNKEYVVLKLAKIYNVNSFNWQCSSDMDDMPAPIPACCVLCTPVTM